MLCVRIHSTATLSTLIPLRAFIFTAARTTERMASHASNTRFCSENSTMQSQEAHIQDAPSWSMLGAALVQGAAISAIGELTSPAAVSIAVVAAVVAAVLVAIAVLALAESNESSGAVPNIYISLNEATESQTKVRKQLASVGPMRWPLSCLPPLS